MSTKEKEIIREDTALIPDRENGLEYRAFSVLMGTRSMQTLATIV